MCVKEIFRCKGRWRGGKIQEGKGEWRGSFMGGLVGALRQGKLGVKGVFTGFVGREEIMLSIDSRRSGYISARRTSRSVGGGGEELAGLRFIRVQEIA